MDEPGYEKSLMPDRSAQTERGREYGWDESTLTAIAEGGSLPDIKQTAESILRLEDAGMIQPSRGWIVTPKGAEAVRAIRARNQAVGTMWKTVTINGAPHEVTDPISYEEVVILAGLSPGASATYQCPRRGGSQRAGIMMPGQSVAVEEGMRFSVAWTGNA